MGSLHWSTAIFPSVRYAGFVHEGERFSGSTFSFIKLRRQQRTRQQKLSEDGGYGGSWGGAATIFFY